jgi:hypothetical protein
MAPRHPERWVKNRDKPRQDRLRTHSSIFISPFVSSVIVIGMTDEACAKPPFTSYSYCAFCAVRGVLPFSG